MTEDEIIQACDPGIRETVRRLRDAGFQTTDSGDGVTKLAEGWDAAEVCPFPHVAARSDPDRMRDHADLMRSILGDTWAVEASYSANDQTAMVLAYQPGER